MTASFASIREQVAAGDASGGWLALTQVFGYPHGGSLDAEGFAEAMALALTITRELAGPDGVADLARAATAPDDPRALYDAGWWLAEQRQFAIAASVLERANQIAPGQPGIVGELANALEHLLYYGPAALVVEASGRADDDPLLAYLSGFYWLMCGDLERPRARLQRLAGATEANLVFMREALAAMLARADALAAAGVGLDEGALTAWHAVLNGSLLLHESPHGYPEPMHGRYAFLNDSPALQRLGLDRLQRLLAAVGHRPERILSAPDRASRILAHAAARVLDLPLAPWTDDARRRGLVVAWSLDAVEEPAFLGGMRMHAPGRPLFVHVTDWIEPFAYAPDVATVLAQVVRHPFTGGALTYDPATRKIAEAEADSRDEAELGGLIAATAVADDSATPLERVIDLDRALAGLPAEQRLGLRREAGSRLIHRAGSPVPSNRFT
ncbi:hypothetical protein SAMN02745121_04028 [Nannocystis exedens]|uniref:Uncharacterized protein n=1 Tax=Nannocystis exedens TaxID=54 RepID=A0A1I1ZXP8_9BACT|nr:hypothetical protein [Nannocystis exedens]PCC75249.1 hypothetical protein NAEX_08358 [Nannocystis exedens]SFE36426.1 hypothetical protein SAMN02745121_04028 [Nannocystis exedens]